MTGESRVVQRPVCRRQDTPRWTDVEKAPFVVHTASANTTERPEAAGRAGQGDEFTVVAAVTTPTTRRQQASSAGIDRLQRWQVCQ